MSYTAVVCQHSIDSNTWFITAPNCNVHKNKMHYFLFSNKTDMFNLIEQCNLLVFPGSLEDSFHIIMILN